MIHDLIERDRTHPKRILVIGDAMKDVWVEGQLEQSQEGCQKFIPTEERLRLPGGAANAARQLDNWNSTATLVSGGHWSEKWRFCVNRKPVFRRDCDVMCGPGDFDKIQDMMAKCDAILLCDYDKGFLSEELVDEIITASCVPVVADAKRKAEIFDFAILKVNEHYGHAIPKGTEYVRTHGHSNPTNAFGGPIPCQMSPVAVKNTVGAGDCFAIHLTLALAHGFTLEQAATFAHSAGRVYVTRHYCIPPSPIEIARDMHPITGKIISYDQVEQIGKCSDGPIVFTNGVFRLPHAGHASLLNWARQQGGLLVAAVNDDESARKVKDGQFVLPVNERAVMLASMQSVDWVVVLCNTDPTELIRQIKPDVLVKGPDYQNKRVAGCEFVPRTLIAPESPFPNHATDLVEAIVAGE
jgi:rfaE bifunctional protein nucleotidyltransferase chain/domain